MNFLKFLIIIFVLVGFVYLVKHYIDIDKYNFNYDKIKIPVIEADNKPYRILPPPEDFIDDPEKDSCTLNNEC